MSLVQYGLRMAVERRIRQIIERQRKKMSASTPMYSTSLGERRKEELQEVIQQGRGIVLMGYDPIAGPQRPQQVELGPREFEVLDALCTLGLSGDYIAIELGLSRHTVRVHLHDLYSKFGLTPPRPQELEGEEERVQPTGVSQAIGKHETKENRLLAFLVEGGFLRFDPKLGEDQQPLMPK